MAQIRDIPGNPGWVATLNCLHCYTFVSDDKYHKTTKKKESLIKLTNVTTNEIFVLSKKQQRCQ